MHIQNMNYEPQTGTPQTPPCIPKVPTKAPILRNPIYRPEVSNKDATTEPTQHVSGCLKPPRNAALDIFERSWDFVTTYWLYISSYAAPYWPCRG